MCVPAEWAQLEVVLWHDAPRDGSDGRLGTASVPLTDALWSQQGPEPVELKLKGADGMEVCSMFRNKGHQPGPHCHSAGYPATCCWV